MKDAIRTNFDGSPDAYGAYERRTGRFEALAERLFDAMADRAAGTTDAVLDAGAGSGVSTEVLKRHGTTPVAADLSRGMLSVNPASNRVQCDFDSLPFVADAFDAVAFTASLFLTPEPRHAAREARRVLRTGGVVGAVAPLGWTTDDGADVFAPLSRESRSPAGAGAVKEALRGSFSVETGTWAFPTTAPNLRAFHSIPAMSARLYPRLDADERIRRARALLADVEGPLEQRWRWFVGT